MVSLSRGGGGVNQYSAEPTTARNGIAATYFNMEISHAYFGGPFAQYAKFWV